MREHLLLTIDQTATGDNNNTASRGNGMGPVIEADGYFDLKEANSRFDILVTGTDTAVFTVQVFTKKLDGTEHPISDAIAFTADGTNTIFQEPSGITSIKLKVTAYTTGTLNAEIICI